MANNLFAGLESLGLGKLQETKIFDNSSEKKKTEEGKEANAQAEIKESDIVFDKTYTCAVCDREFKSKTVKTGKVKLVSTDSDLRPRYQVVDTLKYDAVTCPYCGYSALARDAAKGLTTGQRNLIKENVSKSFSGIDEPAEIYSYDDAITRHKLALLCSVIKKGKCSEKAYICLRLAWLTRGKAEELPDSLVYEGNRKGLHQQESEFMESAYDGFNEAFSKENFPMEGMDDNTVTFITAELARRLGKYDDSKRLASRIITSRNVSDRIKEKARMIIEQIKEAQGETDQK